MEKKKKLVAMICENMFGKNMICYKIEKKRKKSARSSIGLERLTTDQEVRGSTPLGRTKFKIKII